jgi:hypothetical protein
MKKILLTSFFLLSSCLFSLHTLHAQTWQWGKRGGGADALSNNAYGPENVRRIATDAQGNVFAISTVSKTALNIDGNTKTHYGQSSLMANGALASFSCTGAYRWSKIIGGDAGGSIADVQTDALGNVYITGYLPAVGFGNQNHFDSDLILPYCVSGGGMYDANCQTFFIAKYSNTGSLLWTKFPEADNITTSVSNGTGGVARDMSIDTAGNLYILCCLYPGSYADGAYVNTIPNLTYHVLKYNDQGVFQGGFPLNMTSSSADSDIRMVRNNTTGAIYLSGFTYYGYSGPVINGNVSTTNRMFLIAFNALGNYLWKLENTDPEQGQLTDVTLDSEGNIYVAGGAATSGNQFGWPGDSFAGQAFVGDYNSWAPAPFVVKLNSSGTAIWSANAKFATGNYPSGIVLNGNEVAISLDPNLLKWENEQLLNVPNGGSNPAIIRLSKTTGELLGMTQIESTIGSYDKAGSIAADALGNYYLGGGFVSQLYPGTSTLLNSGSESDFFIAKYGTANCTCQVPTCSYKAKNTAAQPNTFDFKYIGQEVYTTVSWNFGDGSPTSNLVNPTHTYAATGVYNVCVTATNACDTYTFCKNLDTSILGTGDFVLENKTALLLYPNPAQNQVNIQYESQAAIAQLEIYDLTGRLIASHSTTEAKGTWQLPLHNMASGIYVVVLKENNQIIMQKKLQVL